MHIPTWSRLLFALLSAAQRCIATGGSQKTRSIRSTTDVFAEPQRVMEEAIQLKKVSSEAQSKQSDRWGETAKGSSASRLQSVADSRLSQIDSLKSEEGSSPITLGEALQAMVPTTRGDLPLTASDASAIQAADSEASAQQASFQASASASAGAGGSGSTRGASPGSSTASAPEGASGASAGWASLAEAVSAAAAAPAETSRSEVLQGAERRPHAAVPVTRGLAEAAEAAEGVEAALGQHHGTGGRHRTNVAARLRAAAERNAQKG